MSDSEYELQVINKLIDEGRLVGTFDRTGAPFHFMNSVSRHTGQPGAIIVWLQPEGFDDDLETPMTDGQEENDDVITMTLHRADLESADNLGEKLDDEVWEEMVRMMENHGSLLEMAVQLLHAEFEIGNGKLRKE